jgi:hypothetical protein
MTIAFQVIPKRPWWLTPIELVIIILGIVLVVSVAIYLP